jgi:hypothetical protein
MADENDGKGDKSGKRDFLGTLESITKSLAAVGVLLGSVAIPIIIHMAADQNHRTQVYMQIMSEREKSDTAIRQEMFKTLLTNYLGVFEDKAQAKQSDESFRKRIMFLDLLNLNFQEYLNTQPLFEDVYSRLEQAKAERIKGSKELETTERLQQDLIRVARNVAASQSAMLARLGLNREFSVKKGDTVCVRLYPVEDLTEWMDKDDITRGSLEEWKSGSCREGVPRRARIAAAVRQPQRMDKGAPAIDVEVDGVDVARARVKVTPYQESFKDGTLNFVRADKAISLEVSPFDLPYMDNMRLFDGSRFALVLSQNIDVKEEVVFFNAIIFREEFMSLRDRPFFEEMLQRLNMGKTK